MLDGEFQKQLESVPDVELAIDELFRKARDNSEARFFVSIVDVVRSQHSGKRFRECQGTALWAAQQFAEYFSAVVAHKPQDFESEDEKNFVRRLHFLAYSQFWECLAVQKLLRSLVRIASGMPYDPSWKWNLVPKAGKVMNDVIKQAMRSNLEIGKVIKVLYRNEIRDCFAHSDFWISGEWIMLFSNIWVGKSESKLRNLQITTWERLFDLTSRFVVALFKRRLDSIRQLRTVTPYRVVLNEFSEPFDLVRDDRGYWSARPTL
jgi:hypothetical protein